MATTWTELLGDAFARSHDTFRTVVGERSAHLRARPGPDANPIGWLAWHAARVEDDHLAALVDTPQVWADGWADRLALPYERDATGYGHTSAEVAAFSAEAPVLLGYRDAVHRRTGEILTALADADLDRVVDDRWDPPVTLAVRLVSVVDDVAQHAGQAAYVAGLLARGPLDA